MSQKLAKFVYSVAIAAMSVMPFAWPLASRAAENPPTSGIVGSWAVTNLATAKDGWQLESYKVDRNLVAWTETSLTLQQRRLYLFDGQTTKLLATLAWSEWADEAGAPFYDLITGSYDLADGLVVWVGTDGNDREIWSSDGYATKRVSDNSYDDRHPVTSRGSVAWTSQPPNSSYNLMIKNAAGVWRRLDSWHVVNYAFSGDNLFWLNRRANENWFRVFRYDGQYVAPIGEGDDRALRDYFLTDGKGGAAWEYSTQRWDYDKRVIYASFAGGEALRVLQRDVPPNVTRLEDFDGNRGVLVNTTDLMTSFLNDTTLITANVSTTKAVTRQLVPSQARYVTTGVVRHQTPETGSPLMLTGISGGDDLLSLERVNHDVFDADGDLIAGAIIGGKLLVVIGKNVEILPTAGAVSDVQVRGGSIAWLEIVSGLLTLKSAQPTLLVRSANGIKAVAGSLIKSADSSQVYLAGQDGKRYAFLSESQYKGWYADFRLVRTVPTTVVGSLPLAGNVLYRPGYRLLRAASSPRIYAVGSGAKLHWLASVEVAQQSCGNDWTKQVDVLADSLFAEYPVGEPITDPFRYYIALAN